MDKLHRPWMMHDMERATIVTEEKPGLAIARFDGISFTNEENDQHAQFAIAACNGFSSDNCDCPTFIAMYYDHRDDGHYVTEACHSEEDAMTWLRVENQRAFVPQPAIMQIHFDGTVSVESVRPLSLSVLQWPKD